MRVVASLFSDDDSITQCSTRLYNTYLSSLFPGNLLHFRLLSQTGRNSVGFNLSSYLPTLILRSLDVRMCVATLVLNTCSRIKDASHGPPLHVGITVTGTVLTNYMMPCRAILLLILPFVRFLNPESCTYSSLSDTILSAFGTSLVFHHFYLEFQMRDLHFLIYAYPFDT
jgi:hypothetical protein